MKNKLKRLTKIVILFIGIIFTITNCSNEELTTDDLTVTQKIKNQFTLEDFDNPFVQKNLQINWNSFKLNTSETTLKSTYEFSTTLKANDFIDNGDTKLFFKYTLEATKIKDNQWEFEIIKFITEDIESLKNASSFLSNDFYGTIAYFNLKGKLLETIAFEKGIKVTPKLHNTTFAKTGPITTDHDPSDSESGGAGFQWIEIVHYTDWYKVYPDGIQEYTHRVYNYSTWEYVYVSSTSNYTNNIPYYNHESNENFAVGSYNNENIADYDKITLDNSFKSNPKTNCTYNQLNKNETIKVLLKEFFGDDAKFDLNFQVIKDLTCNHAGNLSGCTQSNLESNNSITIKVDQDYVNNSQTPTLFIARTIIHEAIHANLYLAVYNHENGNQANIPDIDDFPSIYEKYRGINGLQHEVMANLYIGLIANTLKEVHPLLDDQAFIDSLNDYDMTLNDFYTSIAYVGLNGTNGQKNFLSNPDNAANYSISYETAKVNSTTNANCN